jgi:hypothetical protein
MMLEEAHKGLEAMSAACNAVKGEEWGEAERNLHEVQEIVGRLLREVGDNGLGDLLARRSADRTAGRGDDRHT